MRVRPILPAGSRRASIRCEGSESILLVDDDPDVRVAIRRMVELYGYRVVEAATGEAAIEWMSRHADIVDLLLSDITMPGMGGRELAQQLRAIRPDLKVLYMSGFTPQEDEAGPNGATFIAKPFSAADLAGRIRFALTGIAPPSPDADSPES